MTNLDAIYVDVDDFCLLFEPQWQVCHNLRIPRHKVFDGMAKRGKGTMWWFYGFKLHLIMVDEGGLLAVKVTQIEHTRNRSCVSFMVNLMDGLISNTFKTEKPSINVTRL